MTSEQLFYDKKTGFDRLTDEDKQGIQTYAEGYKKFLDESKTERDAVLEIARMAESKGFRAWTRDDTLRPGDKIYRINRHKGIMLAVIGEKSLAEGVRLTAAHLDAPRVDIRTVPLYEDNGMAFFKTHYYGGIKKYQWTAIPLELRGVVCVCENGEVIYQNDPVIRRVLDQMIHGFGDGVDYTDIANLLLHGGNGGPADRYMSLKDFASYAAAQERVSEVYRDQDQWNRMALINIANSGRFAADRSIAEYAQNIWRVKTNFAF